MYGLKSEICFRGIPCADLRSFVSRLNYDATEIFSELYSCYDQIGNESKAKQKDEIKYARY